MQAPLATPFGRQVQPPGFTREWLLSAGVHLALIALVALLGHRAIVAERAAGEGAGAGGGGGGGWGRALAVFHTPVPEAPAPPPIREVETLALPIEAPTLEPVLQQDTTPSPAAAAEVEAPSPASGDGLGAGAGAGPGAGPGSGGGSGAGSGGGVGSGIGPDSGGAGGRIHPPQAHGMILPPLPSPRALRGRRVTVTFTIGERGEVLAVRVEPPIEDRGYRAQFLERMRGYTFTPGYTPGGRPVRAEYPITITL
jgi:protein TonB